MGMPELKWARDKKVEEIEDELDEKEAIRLNKWGKILENKSIQRVTSGIPGLDPLMEGGFIKGSNIIVSGLQGTGKTAFAIGFIAEGCKNGEKCLYITAEQSPASIMMQSLQFQMPYPKWEAQGDLQFAYLNFKKPMSTKLLNYIIRTIEQNPWDRMAIDSISALMDAPFASFNNILELFEKTAEYDITTVCVARKVAEKDRASEFIEYVGDALINLEAGTIGKTPSRTLQYRKMRLTNVERSPHNYEITKNGFTLLI